MSSRMKRPEPVHAERRLAFFLALIILSEFGSTTFIFNKLAPDWGAGWLAGGVLVFLPVRFYDFSAN